MAKRTGVPSLLDVAREMCRLLAKYSGIITALYGSDPAVVAALAAAAAACQQLETALEPHREVEQFPS